MSKFYLGVKKGIPIALGYLSVSFTFGVMAVNGGLPVWTTVLISLTNLTSAGQFAGVNLILAGGGYLEMAVTTLVINLRYMLMSLSLSQKIPPETGTAERLLFGFGITDEVFAVASAETEVVDAKYMYGLISLPILGWCGGTALGAVASELMPPVLSSAMGLGLYAMFLAIILPVARKSRAVAVVIFTAVLVECLFYYLPVFAFISPGIQVILAAIAAAGAGAVLFPVKGEEGAENG